MYAVDHCRYDEVMMVDDRDSDEELGPQLGLGNELEAGEPRLQIPNDVAMALDIGVVDRVVGGLNALDQLGFSKATRGVRRCGGPLGWLGGVLSERTRRGQQQQEWRPTSAHALTPSHRRSAGRCT